ADDSPPPVVVTSDSPGAFYERLSPGLARSNYLFNTGHYTDYDRDWNTTGQFYRGAFGNNGAANINNMLDGTSNTIAVGESRQIKTSTSYGPYWGAGTHTAVHGRIMQPHDQSGNPVASAVPYCSINYPLGGYANGWTDYRKDLQYAWQFGSKHPNG